ncbi:DUF4198 domain-containing protein [Oceanospirillum maris]|uniref:DUF4198 domain-containing protein n=1 Tax=Oceanospirillum maris TaxID=64977 RepID=UPI000414133E|nr:DUF4198 domain-containing protein [Oceanospirillum maris]
MSYKLPMKLKHWGKKAVGVTALALSAAAINLSVAGLAQAHPVWLLPHEFNLSGDKGEWVTVDASASHTIFSPDKALSLDRVAIFTPEGGKQRLGSYFKGQRRSVFDLDINQAGTWKLAADRAPIYFTFYTHGKRNAKKRLFADKQAAQAQLPEDAKNVVTKLISVSAVSYITWQAPSQKVLELKNKGLELAGPTHPSDVVAGDEVSFQFFIDGKPAANVNVELTPHGTKYRNDRLMQKLKTGKDGLLVFTPEIVGPWYLSAQLERDIATDKADSESHMLYMTFDAQLP